jgi:hypothetical protein
MEWTIITILAVAALLLAASEGVEQVDEARVDWQITWVGTIFLAMLVLGYVVSIYVCVNQQTIPFSSDTRTQEVLCLMNWLTVSIRIIRLHSTS